MDIMRRLARFSLSLLLVPALPFAQAFTTRFTLANRTGRALLITPHRPLQNASPVLPRAAAASKAEVEFLLASRAASIPR